MKAIDALKRLERAGSENSRATKKLLDACVVIAQQIEAACPVGVSLPRGYEVVERHSNVGSALYLLTDRPDCGGEYVDGNGIYLHGDFFCWIPQTTREVALVFAHDIADGLLDEITDFLEARARETEESAAVLENSK